RVPRGRGRSVRLGESVAREALSPGSPREATMAHRAEARTAVVAGADLRLAEAATPCRPRHADIARNDLSKSFYPDPRRAEETADGASADGAAGASSQGRQYQERTGTDRRYRLHPRTATQSGHCSGSLWCNERRNSQSKNVIFLVEPTADVTPRGNLRERR